MIWYCALRAIVSLSETMVICLGGNALLREGQPWTFQTQYANACAALGPLADLIGGGTKLVITHGNGPQVGATLLRHQSAKGSVPPLPLDACVGETQGFLGYLLQTALENELLKRNKQPRVATIVTRVLVNEKDLARKPTKPVGPFYTKDQMEALEGMGDASSFTHIEGRGFRRVVLSPDPVDVFEADAVRRLLEGGFTVIASGGGGIALVRRGGMLVGVEGVVDKDLSSQRLASKVAAQRLIILTDVEGAFVNYRKEGQRLLGTVRLAEVERYHAQGEFDEGSMGPKVIAVIRFLRQGGREAVIAHLNRVKEAIRASSGTRIVP